MRHLRLIPTLLFVFALTGCGSDEIEVSEEQSAAQKKVEELGGNWTGRGAISIDFSALRMSLESKTIRLTERLHWLCDPRKRSLKTPINNSIQMSNLKD